MDSLNCSVNAVWTAHTSCLHFWIIPSVTFVLGIIAAILVDRCVKRIILKRYVSKVKRQLSTKKEHTKLKSLINYQDEKVHQKEDVIQEINDQDQSCEKDTEMGDDGNIWRQEIHSPKSTREVAATNEIKNEKPERKKIITKPPLPPPKVPPVTNRVSERAGKQATVLL